jgi:hypothetical protein
LAAHHGDQALESVLAIRKEIDVLELVGDGAREVAGIEPQGHYEDLIQRHLACAVQGVADLGLETALF